MLATVSAEVNFAVLNGSSLYNSGIVANSDNSQVLGMPSFDGVTRSELPRTNGLPPANPAPPANPVPPPTPTPVPPVVPPASIPPLPQVTPPSDEIPPFIPPTGEAGKHQEPSWNPTPDVPPVLESPPPIVEEEAGATDPGGQIDIGEFTPTVEPADPSPADVAAERETRAVLQMLSTLEYSVERHSGDRLADSGDDSDFQALFRDVANQLNELNDTDLDGGAVSIAADEVAAELQAARTWEPSYELLRDVSVQLETSSGRYQAFEVATFGEEMLPIAEADDSLLPVPPTTFESSWSGEELPVAEDAASESPEQLPAIDGAPLSSAQPVDESRKLTWTSAVAIVTLGIVLQIFRDWKLESLRTQAAVAWQQWVGSYPWFRRRSSASRQHNQSLPQTAYAQQSLVTEPQKTA